MPDLKKHVLALINLVEERQVEEAIDRFYDEHIVSHENENAPTVGLEEYRKTVKRLIQNRSNHQVKHKHFIISDGMAVIEWHYQFDLQGLGKMEYDQVSVQRWKNGKIVHERHHYRTARW